MQRLMRSITDDYRPIVVTGRLVVNFSQGGVKYSRFEETSNDRQR